MRYDSEKRDELADMLFDKLKELAQGCKNPLDFRNLSVSYGILVDKCLLSEGKATSRSEITADDSNAIESLREMLLAKSQTASSTED